MPCSTVSFLVKIPLGNVLDCWSLRIFLGQEIAIKQDFYNQLRYSSQISSANDIDKYPFLSQSQWCLFNLKNPSFNYLKWQKLFFVDYMFNMNHVWLHLLSGWGLKMTKMQFKCLCWSLECAQGVLVSAAAGTRSHCCRQIKIKYLPFSDNPHATCLMSSAFRQTQNYHYHEEPKFTFRCVRQPSPQCLLYPGLQSATT